MSAGRLRAVPTRNDVYAWRDMISDREIKKKKKKKNIKNPPDQRSPLLFSIGQRSKRARDRNDNNSKRIIAFNNTTRRRYAISLCNGYDDERPSRAIVENDGDKTLASVHIASLRRNDSE